MRVKGSDLLITHPKAVFGEITVIEITGNAWKGVKRRKRNERENKKTQSSLDRKPTWTDQSCYLNETHPITLYISK